jgi:symplekin
MADPQQATRDMITNLEKARKMALGDSALYSQIVPSVLHLIGPGAALDLRRWGADFLAEAFSCPTLASELKEQMCLQVLNLLKRYLEASGEDSAVIKSVVITATSIYPLVFKHT